MTIVITARRKKKFIYMRNDKFRPDLELLTNPPYPDFVRIYFTFMSGHFRCISKKGEPWETIGDRYSQFSEQNTYEDLCIGLEILMPYMCKTESGKVIINDEGYLSV